MPALGVFALPPVELLHPARVKGFLSATLLPTFKCQNYTYEGKIETALAKQLWANNFVFPLKSELHPSRIFGGFYYFL